MAEQKILISININDKQAKKSADGVAHSLTKIQKAQEALNFELSESGKEYAKLTAATNDQKLANNLAAKSAVDMAKGIKQGRTQSGLNNAILLETGRLASDASYGFTAIANNLSQVVTLFSSFVKTQGSVSASFRELFKSIMGTGGLLIGIQLLISFGPKLIDMFMRLMGETMKLSDVFKDASKEVTGTAGKFETYTKTLQDSSKSQQEQQDAINSLKKEFPDYIKQLDDAGLTLDDVAKGTKEARKENDIYRESIVKLAMARAAQNKIDEEAAKQVQAETDLRIKAREKFGKSTEDLQKLEAEYEKFKETNTQKGRAREKAFTKAFSLEEKQILRLIRARNEQVEESQKNIDALIEFTDIEVKENERSGRSRKKRSRTFKAADLDYEKETQQSQERLLKSFIEDEKRKVAVKFDGIRTRARLKQTEFEEDQQRRLDEFKASDATEAEKAEAQKRFDEEIAKSKESLSAYIVQLKQEETTEVNNLTIEQAQKIIDADRELQYKQQENAQRITDQQMSNEGLKLSRLNEIKDANVEKERIRIEQQLQNEKLSFEERMRLQKELTDVEQEQVDRRVYLAELEVDGKAKLVDLVGKSLSKASELAGEATSTGKTLAIAGTLISTYSAAQSAFESQFEPEKDVTSPIRGALAAALAVASGFQRLKEIKKVKVPKEKGGAGGANVIQAPSFNVVGASQTSQLAETVAGQQDKPVKAFVVGKDISTQQELDRNITNTASFG
jgi:hypothetical protein